MAPFDATASGVPGATQLSLALFSGTAFEEEAFCLEDILPYDPAYDAELVPEEWFGADGDSVVEYLDWLEAQAFDWEELGDTQAAQQELLLLDRARDNDPYHPWNQSFFRHCLLTDHTLFQRVVLVGALWRMTVLVSPEDEAVRSIRWHVARCGGHRYARNGSDLYLHVFVMRRMLWDDAALRARMLKQFGVTPSRANHPHTVIESEVERLMAVGIVHHRNHDTADCRRDNLELVTEAANMRQAQQKPGASGYVGVRRRSVNGHWKFEALVERHRKGFDQSKRLGVYLRPEHAALARALFLLAHPAWLVTSYTPTKQESAVWETAKALVMMEAITDLTMWELLANHRRFSQLLGYARQQVSKGRAVQVRERDGGH